jgi:mono/diheme cytochrome c family protein
VRTSAAVLSLLALALAAGSAGGASAAGDPDAAKGLVAQRCASCHKVPGQSESGLATLDAPAFQTIADEPEVYTEERVRASLLKPHWPMKQFHLSPSNIDNLVAYLQSLKRP